MGDEDGKVWSWDTETVSRLFPVRGFGSDSSCVLTSLLPLPRRERSWASSKRTTERSSGRPTIPRRSR